MLPLPDGTVIVMLADTSPTISLGLPPTSTVTNFDDPHGFVYDNIYGTVLTNRLDGEQLLGPVTTSALHVCWQSHSVVLMKPISRR